MTEPKKLYRSSKDRMLWGVCAGLAEYFNIDVALVRLIFVILFFAQGFGLLAYIVLFVLMPEQGAPVTPPVSTRTNGKKTAPSEKPTFEPLGSRQQDN